MMLFVKVYNYCFSFVVSTYCLGRVASTCGVLIYDTEYNLIWFSDANYAKTINYDAEMSLPGIMTKTTAEAWVDGLEYT